LEARIMNFAAQEFRDEFEEQLSDALRSLMVHDWIGADFWP
jgi:hypothetical protein